MRTIQPARMTSLCPLGGLICLKGEPLDSFLLYLHHFRFSTHNLFFISIPGTVGRPTNGAASVIWGRSLQCLLIEALPPLGCFRFLLVTGNVVCYCAPQIINIHGTHRTAVGVFHRSSMWAYTTRQCRVPKLSLYIFRNSFFPFQSRDLL